MPMLVCVPQFDKQWTSLHDPRAIVATRYSLQNHRLAQHLHYVSSGDDGEFQAAFVTPLDCTLLTPTSLSPSPQSGKAMEARKLNADCGSGPLGVARLFVFTTK